VADRFKADGKEVAPPLPDKTSPAVDRNELRFVEPRAWDATRPDPWWRQSSFDLHRGLEVNEDAIDTIPAELFDELFKR
jgi:hypothetical protein